MRRWRLADEGVVSISVFNRLQYWVIVTNEVCVQSGCDVIKKTSIYLLLAECEIIFSRKWKMLWCDMLINREWMLSQCEYLIPKIMDPCFLQLATEQENGHPEKNESSCTTTTDIIYNCLVGQIFVRQNATTCLSLRQEQLGRQSFYVAAPTIWNALPSQFCSSSITCGQFRVGLKTHLFTQAYGHLWELLLKSILFYVYFDVLEFHVCIVSVC